MDNKGISIKKVSVIILLVFLLLGSAVGGYLYFSRVFFKKTPQAEETMQPAAKMEDLFSLRIYYPVDSRLQIEERRLPRRTKEIAIAETLVGEFLKGPAGGMQSNIPQNARLLSIYKDGDRIFYIDLSDEFRRNFHGDAFTEFLLLKGLYESLISNIQDIQDVKVLIEGREVDTLGGHLYLSYPLKDIVSGEYESER